MILLHLIYDVRLRGPSDNKPLIVRRTRLGDDVEVYVVDDLVCDAAVILEDVVVLEPLCSGDLLRDGHHIREVFVWELVELCRMVFRNDQSMAFGEGANVKE